MSKVESILNGMSFSELTVSMVIEDAEAIVAELKQCDADTTMTQFRKFYEEIDILYRKMLQKTGSQTETEAHANAEEIFNKQFLPRIKMVLPKIAYAKGREKIPQAFYDLFRLSIGKVNSRKEFINFKLFIEAILGFFKYQSTLTNNR